MGGNRVSKQIKNEEKIDQSNSNKPLPQAKQQQRDDQLQNPVDHRPIELSWLQQNNSHDNYHRMEHIHHHHHEEHRRRIPLAINRWPKIDDENSKTFVEEYIHQ